MTLTSLGLLILLGFACAWLMRRLNLPSVTGYLVVGLLLGPSVLHVVGPEAIAALKPLTTFCLATIFFLLGEEFRIGELRRLGARFLAITVTQSLVTFAVVTTVLLALKTPAAIALLMGAIAGTTDPAATLGVIRELRARGELVRTLLAVVALNSLVEMILFNGLLPVVEYVQQGTGGVTPWLGSAREIGGSIGLGLLLAGALRAWAWTRHGRESLKLPTVGLLVLGAGLCEIGHFSVLLTMLVFGAGVVNGVPLKVQVFDVAKAMEGPLLVVFFALSGSSLHLADLRTVGWLGVAYIASRVVGKLVGSSLGSCLAGSTGVCRRYLGVGLIPQAGMAIGLAYVVQQQFPALAGPILPVTLGAVVVFEALGPMLTRTVLIRSGEVPPRGAEGHAPAPVPLSVPG